MDVNIISYNGATPVDAVFIATETRSLSIDLNKEAPNVVTELQFKNLLRRGYLGDVIAQDEPFRKGSFWYGTWICSVVDAKRSTELFLVPMRTKDSASEAITIREFKTANGLISFLHKIGMQTVSVPMQKGARASHKLPKSLLGSHSNEDTRNSGGQV